MSTLLDPSLAAQYGRFVVAAYAMYALQPPSPHPAAHGLPAGWELSAWIRMSDFLLGSTAPKFYGIVAFETAHPDRSVIALRGTEGIVEWLDDAASIALVPFHQAPAAGKVAFGFDRIYSTIKVLPVPKATAGRAPEAVPELTGSFLDQLAQLAAHREAQRGVAHPMTAGQVRAERPTVVTGHSLGSALATLFVMENSVKHAFDVTLLSTLASPKVGNGRFRQALAATGVCTWDIVNTADVVPKLPPTIPLVLDFEPVDTVYRFDSRSFAKAGLGCYHHIETYMHWLDAAVPLRSDCQP